MLYRTLELTVSPALRAIYRPEVDRLEHVPRTGPVIIAGNHVSFADEIFTPLAARRQVFYFAKAEYFNTPGLKGRGDGGVLRTDWARCRSSASDTRSAAAVDRHRRRRARGGTGARHLSRGHPLPRRPALQVPHRRRPAGAAHRVHRSCRSAWSAPARCSRPAAGAGTARRSASTSARRWTSPAGAEDERSARVLREVTETIREAVQALSGQEYVDAYASTVTSTDRARSYGLTRPAVAPPDRSASGGRS